MATRTPFRASLFAVAIASAAGFAFAQNSVTDTRGEPVTSSAGDCVSNVYGTVDCPPVPGTQPPVSPQPYSEATPLVSPSDEQAPPTATAPVIAAPSEFAAVSPTMQRSPAEAGYIIDSTGEAVQSTIGDCISGVTGASPEGVPECGGVVAQAAVPVPEPVPVEPQAAAPREIPLQRITLDTDTTFNFDSAELTNEGQEQLKNIVDAAKSENIERMRVHVTGYTDRIGPDEYNLDLSERRANAVRDYFVAAGLPADVITIQGKGESNPLVQCEGMRGVSLIECLRPNRRSEVEFAALERAEQASVEEAPVEEAPVDESAPATTWTPGTDTGTPR